MMVPVGRLVILRSVPKAELVSALAYLTIPALIGPIIGPPLGGLITTCLDWRWIFFINIPIGILGIVLASLYIADIREPERPPLDRVGFVLLGLGLATLMLGLASTGRHLLPAGVSWGCLGGGTMLLALYFRHSRRGRASGARLDLLRYPTFRAAVTGGQPVPHRHRRDPVPAAADAADRVRARSAAIGPDHLRGGGRRDVREDRRPAHPARLRLPPRHGGERRDGLGLPGRERPVHGRRRRTGDHRAALRSAAACARSQFTCVNAIAYADLESRDMSAGTSLASVAQQISLSLGVTVGALALEAAAGWHGRSTIAAADFAPAFVTVALISAASVFAFLRLAPDAGAEVSGQRLAAAPPSGAPGTELARSGNIDSTETSSDPIPNLIRGCLPQPGLEGGSRSSRADGGPPSRRCAPPQDEGSVCGWVRSDKGPRLHPRVAVVSPHAAARAGARPPGASAGAPDRDPLLAAGFAGWRAGAARPARQPCQLQAPGPVMRVEQEAPGEAEIGEEQGALGHRRRAGDMPERVAAATAITAAKAPSASPVRRGRTPRIRASGPKTCTITAAVAMAFGAGSPVPASVRAKSRDVERPGDPGGQERGREEQARREKQSVLGAGDHGSAPVWRWLRHHPPETGLKTG